MKAKNLKRKGINTLEPITVQASISQLGYIDSLINNSNFTEKQREELKPGQDISEGQAEELISYLLDNQLCPIESGRNYTQRDIIKKLNKLK